MWVVCLQYSIKCREILRRGALPQNEFNYSNICIATLRGGWTCPFPQEKGGRGSSESDCVLAKSLFSSGMVADANSPLSVFPEQ